MDVGLEQNEFLLLRHQGKKIILSLTDKTELIRLRRENEQLRMEREIIKKGRSLLCQGNRIKYGFIREQQKTYPVTVLCRVMEVSASAFYAWVKKPGNTDRIRKREVFEGKVHQLFYEHKQIYGYRRLSDASGKAGIKSGVLSSAPPNDATWAESSLSQAL